MKNGFFKIKVRIVILFEKKLDKNSVMYGPPIIMILFLIIQNSENFASINLQMCVRFPDMMCYLKIKKLSNLGITTFCTDYNNQTLHMVFL